MQKVASSVSVVLGQTGEIWSGGKRGVCQKMITMTTLTKETRGPFVFSMLDAGALTAVEHLKFAEFAVDGGETDFQHTRSQIS